MYALYKTYNGERAWKDIEDRLQAPYYKGRFDHCWKIRSKKIRRDVGKFSFVNRTIADWNQLPEGAIGTSHGFYVLLTSLCINVLTFCIFCIAVTRSIFLLLHYFCITVYVMFIVYVTLPPGVSPIAVGNKDICI
jgi:hypothetical protein